MSEQSADKMAWVWYEADTLVLRHVGFNPDQDYGPGMAKLAMHYESALDIISGKSRLFEYELVYEHSDLVLNYRKQSKPFKKFWQLIDPEQQNIHRHFDLATSDRSPIIIKERTKDGFVVDVEKKAKNIVFYITMKNDPNYLIKKIDLYPYAADSASTVDIEIPVDVDGDYSVYVRYDAA